MSKIGKSIETENRLVVTSSWGVGEGERVITSWVWDVFLG